jgi:uncharacterized protein with PQ loop repeat
MNITTLAPTLGVLNGTTLAPASTLATPSSGGGLSTADIIGLLGIIPTLAMFGSPLLTMYRRWKSADPIPTPNMLDPMVGQFANCSVWIAYAIISANPIVIACNSAGFLVAILGMIVYYLRTAAEFLKRQRIILAVVIAIVAGIIFLEAAILPSNVVLHISGSIAVVGSFILYSAPISVIKKVWDTKSTQSLSLPASCGMLFNATWWTVYGIMKPDVFMFLSNVVGIFIMGFALFTLWKFSEKKGSAPSKAVEMTSPSSTAVKVPEANGSQGKPAVAEP